jgi:hypothetical protein
MLQVFRPLQLAFKESRLATIGQLPDNGALLSKYRALTALVIVVGMTMTPTPIRFLFLHLEFDKWMVVTVSVA